MSYFRITNLLIILTAVFRPSSTTGQHLFEEILPKQSGIHFYNLLKESPETNIITYEYYYNGGGVAAGDFNNDGLVDLYFTANLESNKLFLNKGNFSFEDITKKANVGGRKGWKTGVSVADVNGDGWLDIYVCYSGDVDPKHRQNQLFINNGDLSFSEEAKKYNIADEGHTTHAAFFDMDRDGDLDLYVLNHNVKQFRNFDAAFVKSMVDPDAGDRLYENQGGVFTDVTSSAGIRSNPLGYGLGLNIADVNNDGWPDIYVSNDYVEEDYLYLNQHDGTFKEILKEQLQHISNFSMGVDIGDINNDGWLDIFTLDMLPADNKRQKLIYAPDNFELYNNMVDNGFHHQLMRNMLHLNNGNGSFSEIGQLAGVSNTDWSWAALLADYDLDGFSDLFVTNGYGRDMINRDFMKFYANERLKHTQGKTDDKMFQMLQSIHSTPLSNYIFKNLGNTQFEDRTIEWGISREDFAHGAVYADLDNDGDLDIIFNRMNEEAGVYRNMAIERNPDLQWIQIRLTEKSENTQAIGSRITMYTGTEKIVKENHLVHGFQSSMAVPVHFGLSHRTIDSISIRWPDGTWQLIKPPLELNRIVDISYPAADIKTYFTKDNSTPALFSDLPEALPYIHHEVLVNDFKVQPLMPNMVSYHGPKMAISDVNADQLEDIYICSPEGKSGTLLLQRPDGSFYASSQPGFIMDAKFEDADAHFFDADGDGDADLYVVSGGFGTEDSGLPLQDRLYLNNNGLFFSNMELLPTMNFAGSTVVSWDVDEDGDLDLFVGGRVEQGKYPLSPGSRLLLNDGKGSFVLAEHDMMQSLTTLGMVTDALLADLDSDGRPELLVCGEWMSIHVFQFNEGVLADVTEQFLPSPMNGWWNTMVAEDLDGDGDVDIIAGNWGDNAQFKPTTQQPLDLYYADFDQNGFIDPLMCYYIQNTSYPVASKDELTDQIVSLRKQYVTYDSYSDVTISKIFGEEAIQNSPKLSANHLSTIWFENKQGQLMARSLPIQVGYAPVYAILVDDFNKDGHKDVLLMGNIEYARIKIGKSDANFGCLLLGDGNGNFEYIPQKMSGFDIKGCVRSLSKVKTAKGNQIAIGVNNNEALLLKYPTITQANE